MPRFRDRPATQPVFTSRLLNPWLAFAAMGAALLHLDLAWAAVAFLAAHPVAVGALCGALAVIGIAELTWGLVALVTDRPASPRLARWAALVPVVGWVLVLVGGMLVGGSTTELAIPFLPMGTATLLNLFIAGALSMRLRVGHRVPSPGPEAGHAGVRGAFLVVFVAAPLVVSALVAPALFQAATWPGQAPNLPIITPGHRSH